MHRTSVFSVCHDQGQQASRAISVCSEVLQSDPENVNGLKDRAEAYIQEEQYEEGEPVRCRWDLFSSLQMLRSQSEKVPCSEPESHTNDHTVVSNMKHVSEHLNIDDKNFFKWGYWNL